MADSTDLNAENLERMFEALSREFHMGDFLIGRPNDEQQFFGPSLIELAEEIDAEMDAVQRLSEEEFDQSYITDKSEWRLPADFYDEIYGESLADIALEHQRMELRAVNLMQMTALLGFHCPRCGAKLETDRIKLICKNWIECDWEYSLDNEEDHG